MNLRNSRRTGNETWLINELRENHFLHFIGEYEEYSVHALKIKKGVGICRNYYNEWNILKTGVNNAK